MLQVDRLILHYFVALNFVCSQTVGYVECVHVSIMTKPNFKKETCRQVHFFHSLPENENLKIMCM